MVTHSTRESLSRRNVIRAAAGASGLGLAGCLGGGTSEEGSATTDGTTGAGGSGTASGTVRTWSTGPGTENQASQLELASEWASQELGRSVELNHDPIAYEGYNNKLKVEFGSGQAPDIVQLQTMWFESYYNQDQLLDISESVPSGYTDEFFDVFVEPWRKDGGLYGLPKDVQVYVPHWNRGFLDQAGIDELPETWEEFRDTLQTVNDETDVPYPLVEWSSELLSFYAMKFQVGGEVMNEDDSECIVASDANVRVLEFMRSLREDELLGFVSEVEGDATAQALGNEQCACTIAGAWVLPFSAENRPEVYEKLDTGHMPHPADADRNTGVFTLPWGVSSQTSTPQAMATGLRGMDRSEPLWQWIKRGVALSPRKDHQDREFFQSDRRLKTMTEALEYASGPVWQYGTQSEAILNALNQTLEAIYRGNQSPRDGLEKLQQQVNNDILS